MYLITSFSPPPPHYVLRAGLPGLVGRVVPLALSLYSNTTEALWLISIKDHLGYLLPPPMY